MTVEAIEKRREQVRLLEEELAKHSEALEARIREADKRDREFLERQEEFERETKDLESRQRLQQCYADMLFFGEIKEKQIHFLFR